MFATPSRSRLVVRIALIAALGATLGLAACGRKGSLDMPPGAAGTETQTQAVDPDTGERNDPVGVGPDGRPIPRGKRKPMPMDVLLN